MPDPTRLATLTELRKDAGLSLAAMARRCGLRGRQSHQTAGAWERGEYTPKANRRTAWMGYLWDDLGLRRDPAQFEAVWSLLAAEWGWAAVSDAEWAQHFPGVARPMAAVDEEPSGKQAVPPPFQAPGLVIHFVGRASEMQRLADLLAPTDSASVQPNPQSPIQNPKSPMALVGMGGVGKTTLATVVAHALRSRFADGVLWGAAATGSPLDILGSWARAYGYDFSSLSDIEARAAALRNVLNGKQTLLVLDDVVSVERVRPLLPGSAGCRVLLTTRSEEVAAGLGAQVVALTELSPADGVNLLTRILGAARVEREQAAAQEIGDALHHLPLAVEIAAQFLAVRPRRPLAQMAERLRYVHHRLDLQISDRAVRTSFAISWEGLDANHRALFAQLALFAGRSFTAQAIAYAAELDLWTAQDQLETLKALSLVREEGAERYRQHPLLADFASELLGEDAASQMRLADYYLAFAQQHQTDYALLEAEWDGVMGGMKGAYDLGAWDVVATYADVLEKPWFTRAEYARARQGYAWATEAAEAVGDATATAHYLIQWGCASLEQSDEEAQNLLTKGLHAATRLESDDLVGDALLPLARMATERANYREAETLLAACKQARAERGSAVEMAAVDYWRAILAFRRGQHAQAEELCREVLTTQTVHGDQLGLVRTLRLLTDISLANQNYAAARQHAERTLRLAEVLCDQGEQGAALYSLAVAQRYLNNVQGALSHATKSLSLFERMGSQVGCAVSLYELSRAHHQLAAYETALDLGLQSASILRKAQDKRALISVLRYLGDTCSERNQLSDARTFWGEALSVALTCEHPAVSELQNQLDG